VHFWRQITDHFPQATFEVGQGWEPLCAFLGVPIPEEPFPRTNDRQEFADRVRRRPVEES
jgi:Sulfotransferase domain